MRAETKQIEVIEASHPVPDAAGREAAKRILQKVRASPKTISCSR